MSDQSSVREQGVALPEDVLDALDEWTGYVYGNVEEVKPVVDALASLLEREACAHQERDESRQALASATERIATLEQELAHERYHHARREAYLRCGWDKAHSRLEEQSDLLARLLASLSPRQELPR